MDNLTIGEKIRFFRKRANLSQFQLESKIHASNGSISKTENGEVNPTKETLLKIIQALDLNATEAALLFDIKVDKDLTKILQLSRNLNVLDLDQVIKNFVNELILGLNIISSLIWLKEGEILTPTPFTNTWYTDLITKMLPTPLAALSINLNSEKYKNNPMAKAANDRKIYSSGFFADFGEGLLPKKFLLSVEKLLGIKMSVAIPMIIGDRCIGVVTASWNSKEKFESDIGIIEAFSNQLAITIENIYKYRDLEKKLESLSHN